ncbi:b41.1 [Murid betaherpesvirus 8]|uniref:B41.1 n=2 Tax=Muromegalovirus TaxID=10365 RepID=K7YA11_RCMVE|nr:e41.1 [Murid betaherpesvirus 8]ACQ65680.1 mitochondrion-localized antiapoptotic protein e41.1 [Murid betaherpesvirus 2]AFX83364.1 e41.1 [Murid betaherpesvirus 8]AKB93244.1 b41.1 [Murid betaherpesvirus 8]WEG71836.1 protein m41.1 [Murid betaherpesvirus 8]WPH24959.1 b41.1 [Murid betaherpesvirus 8]
MIVTLMVAAYTLLAPRGRLPLPEWEKRALRKNLVAGIAVAGLLYAVTSSGRRIRH